MKNTDVGILSRPLCALAAALLLASCSTVQTTEGGTVGVGRTQRMAVSEAQIEQAARQQYAEVLADARKKGTLNRDAAQLNRIRSISSRLIAQTAVFRPEARNWQWEQNLITAPEVNAWCMPGGKIAVYTGLIEKLRISDDELAAVLGHEIAHALREHARERASQQVGTDLASAGAEIIGSIYGIGGLGKVASTGLQLGIGLPNSRLHETEADRIGVELAARAGYDPRAAISLWQKMAQVSSGAPPEFLSTHPSRESRISDLTEYAQRVMPLFEQARKKR
ncbi:MAG: M48 family metallopeptidase [Oxalobacteraceae bacterium]|nr:M48 family metallopeptidase [Oxalobacteraceae bacterium]